MSSYVTQELIRKVKKDQGVIPKAYMGSFVVLIKSFVVGCFLHLH